MLPILLNIPGSIPDGFELDSPAERARAEKEYALAARNEADRLVWRNMGESPLMMAWVAEELSAAEMAEYDAMMLGDDMPHTRASREEVIKGTQTEDHMVDSIARLLRNVMVPTLQRYRSQPANAPWVPPVVAAGAARKLKELLNDGGSQVGLGGVKWDRVVSACVV